MLPELGSNDEIESELNQSTRSCVYTRKKLLYIIICNLIIMSTVIPIIIIKMKVNDTETPPSPPPPTTMITENILTTTTTMTTMRTDYGLITTKNSSMFMTDTATTILPVSTPVPYCNTSKCRAIIAYYRKKGWHYDTAKLDECSHCPYTNNYQFTDSWLNMWYKEDFFIENSIGQDLEEKPLFTDVRYCAKACFERLNCTGFVRNKNIAVDANGECWLKNNITINRIVSHPEWHTFVLNMTL
ncbi:unnamed protein product [Adineta steineri]|uniref:Uncharacterized protein n=2 Tax=Adineta steineri TaxID=433720 RepID=A0A813Q7B1_9BILA|nr:unnamed protein product [Adineta steineri]